MRPIDADRLKELFSFTCTGGGLLGKISNMIIEWACSFVDEMPTIEAVEVVRCKDCKHSEHWYRDKRRCFLWHETGIDVFEDGFCNYAERRTDE